LLGCVLNSSAWIKPVIYNEYNVSKMCHIHALKY
jgi:hypothetical protein